MIIKPWCFFHRLCNQVVVYIGYEHSKIYYWRPLTGVMMLLKEEVYQETKHGGSADGGCTQPMATRVLIDW